MSYVVPGEVVGNMVSAGAAKGRLPVPDLLIRGFLSGALLGFGTTLAFTAALQTGMPIVGAIIFPAGFVMIVLLGLELVTGNFALVPLAALDRQIGGVTVLRNWGWVFLGNLAGAVAYAAMFIATTQLGTPMADQLVALSEAKTLAYQSQGAAGMFEVFVKAVLCNWMVTMGVVMAFTSRSTVGKIVAMWLPILTFFAQGFEHAVVNMFAIPAGMMLGADVSMSDWWLWNQLPVTIGNVLGGLIFTGLALYLTHRQQPTAVAAPPSGNGATEGVGTLARESVTSR